MFFLLILLCSAAMAQQLAAIVYSTDTECVSGTTEIWVNNNAQEIAVTLTRAEAKDFTVTDELKVTGTLMIDNKTLQEYITTVCNCSRL